MFDSDQQFRTDLQGQIHDSRSQNSLHELFTKLMCAAKLWGFCVQCLFSLTVEGWVDYQAVYEEPKICLYLMRLDDEFLVFLLKNSSNFGNDLVNNVVNMCPSFCGANRVYEGNLLKSAVTQTANNLPSISFSLNNFWKFFVFSILEVVISVLWEVFAG